jgi:hypothetical protein
MMLRALRNCGFRLVSLLFNFILKIATSRCGVDESACPNCPTDPVLSLLIGNDAAGNGRYPDKRRAHHRECV